MISLQSNNKQQAFFEIITVLLITKIARARLLNRITYLQIPGRIQKAIIP